MKDYERDKLKLVSTQLNIFQNEILKKLLLVKNLRKDVWTYTSTEYLFKRLREEVEELRIEIENPKVKVEKIISECADIAAFAMMIADRQRLRNDSKRKFVEKVNQALEVRR